VNAHSSGREQYVVGIDFGTLSGRAVVFRTAPSLPAPPMTTATG
jgi:hypothetical protein